MNATNGYKLETLLKSVGDSFDVSSVVTVPMFVGEETTGTIRHRHGTYTLSEIMRPDYQLMGWVGMGYKVDKFYREDEYTVVVILKFGPVTVEMTYVKE